MHGMKKQMEIKIGDIVEWYGVRGKVIATDMSGDYPILVWFDEASDIAQFTKEGKFCGWHKNPAITVIEQNIFECFWPPQNIDYSSELVGKRVRVTVEVIE